MRPRLWPLVILIVGCALATLWVFGAAIINEVQR